MLAAVVPAAVHASFLCGQADSEGGELQPLLQHCEEAMAACTARLELQVDHITSWLSNLSAGDAAAAGCGSPSPASAAEGAAGAATPGDDGVQSCAHELSRVSAPVCSLGRTLVAQCVHGFSCNNPQVGLVGRGCVVCQCGEYDTPALQPLQDATFGVI